MSTSVPHLFCFGLGYSAQRLAHRLFDEGWRVTGTHRPGEKKTKAVGLGEGEGTLSSMVASIPFSRDMALDDFDFLFETVTHVLVSIPPDAAGDPVVDIHGADLVRHANHIQWAGYLSTVGVYGDTGGRSVDENAPLLPTQERSRFRALAENRWQNLCALGELPLHVFRLAGIYGPGRSVFDKVRDGTAQRIIKPDHLFSRIHVDDIVKVLLASMNHPDPGAIYNVADDEPAAPSDVAELAAKLLGKTPPTAVTFEEASANMSDMARTFWADNRRINNQRIKEELGIELSYPSFREGLKAVLAAGG